MRYLFIGVFLLILLAGCTTPASTPNVPTSTEVLRPTVTPFSREVVNLAQPPIIVVTREVMITSEHEVVVTREVVITHEVVVTRIATITAPPVLAVRPTPPPASTAAPAVTVPTEPALVVTRLVPVTRLIEMPPLEVTRLVEVTRIVPATPQAPTPQPPAAMPSLLVDYDFEDDFISSGYVTDRSGNGLHAYLTGPVGVVSGISGGQAIYLSGSSYLQAQFNPVAGHNRVSFSLWFKTNHPENNYKLASAAWWNSGPGSGWILATHIPEFWSDDTNSLYLSGLVNVDNNFPAGVWVHEAVTYDGNRIKEYTNGQLVNDWPTTGAVIGLGHAMSIGAWPPYSSFNFQGSLDDFRIYSYTLSPQEVLTIYTQR